VLLSTSLRCCRFAYVSQALQTASRLVSPYFGPLASERRDYLLHLAGQGTALPTLRIVAAYLLAIVERLGIKGRPRKRIGLAEITRCAHRWAHRRWSVVISRRRISRGRFVRHATRWLQFIGGSKRHHGGRRLTQTWSRRTRLLDGGESLSLRTVAIAVGWPELSDSDPAPSPSVAEVSARDIDRCWSGSSRLKGTAGRRYELGERAEEFLPLCGTERVVSAGFGRGHQIARCYSGESFLWDHPARSEAPVGSLKGDRPITIRDRAIILLLLSTGCEPEKSLG